jgi:hypothetical protein
LLLFPLLLLILLGIGVSVADASVSQSWLVKAARSAAAIYLLLSFVSTFIRDGLIGVLIKWVGVPIATLQIFGWLDGVTAYLDSISLTLGDIHLSQYALLRTLVFGTVLFWMGRTSNSAGT